MEDVLQPKGHVLLGLTLDPRTGLGTFEEYFRLLLSALRKSTLDEVLDLPEVVARVARMREQDERFREATVMSSHIDGNVIVTDFRPLDSVPVGNRFIVYTLYPEANISLRIHWGPRREKVVLAVGHSIFRRTSRTNVGELMARYNGGGHRGAGTCVVPPDRADAIVGDLLTTMKKDG
jgi:nanoRNase/pAp phosphatase (c-di-AMP/oligoRNAs hydrolase)